MEAIQLTACATCNKQLPPNGFFCGGCLTQFKCKSCNSILEPDNIGCINCGAPKEAKKETQLSNTFRFHENGNDRTIEATFSDEVGKDLAGILRDISASRIKTLASNSFVIQGISENKEQVQLSEEVSNNKFIGENSSPQITNYPTLKAIAMKNLPATETEWIVIYAFYASNFGEKTFSRQDIVKKYEESNRLDENKKSALSMYITRSVQGGYLNPLASDYSILDGGIMKAKEIISRTSSSSPRSKATIKKKEVVTDETEKKTKTEKTKKNRVSGKTPKRLNDLDFYPSGKDSLESFLKKFSIKNDNERNLLFVNYLNEILNIQVVGLDHLYTCYDETKCKIPENLKMSLANTKGRTGWLEGGESRITVTTKGRNKIRFWDKKD